MRAVLVWSLGVSTHNIIWTIPSGVTPPPPPNKRDTSDDTTPPPHRKSMTPHAGRCLLLAALSLLLAALAPGTLAADPTKPQVRA